MAWRMRERSGTSSTRKRGSFSRVSVNSGFSISIRPLSAKYCASSSDIGDTPHGRYLSSQGNALSRLDPRSSQSRKWVSSRIGTVFFERPTQELGFPPASPNSTDQLGRHREPAGDGYSREIVASTLLLIRLLMAFTVGALGPPVSERAAEEENTTVPYRENQLAAHGKNHRARHR